MVGLGQFLRARDERVKTVFKPFSEVWTKRFGCSFVLMGLKRMTQPGILHPRGGPECRPTGLEVVAEHKRHALPRDSNSLRETKPNLRGIHFPNAPNLSRRKHSIPYVSHI